MWPATAPTVILGSALWHSHAASIIGEASTSPAYPAASRNASTDMFGALWRFAPSQLEPGHGAVRAPVLEVLRPIERAAHEHTAAGCSDEVLGRDAFVVEVPRRAI